MPLYPATDPIIAAYVASTDTIVDQTHALATAYHNQNEEFKKLPIDAFLDFLNADIPSTGARLQSRTSLASVINAQLDAVTTERPELATKYSRRVPTGIGREGVTFDQVEGEYIYTAPPEPEPEP